MAANGSANANYQQDWQHGVIGQLAELTRAVQGTAVTLEKLNGRIDAIDSRLKVQEASPSQVRDWLGLIVAGGGCIVAPIMGALVGAAGSLVVGIILYYATRH